VVDDDEESIMQAAQRMDARGDWDEAAELYERIARSSSQHAKYAEQCLKRIHGLQSLGSEVRDPPAVLSAWDFLATASGLALVAMAFIAVRMPGLIHGAFIDAAVSLGIWLAVFCLLTGIARAFRRSSGRFPFLQCLRYAVIFSLPILPRVFIHQDRDSISLARVFNASGEELCSGDLAALRGVV
jgi:hypothetical protein